MPPEGEDEDEIVKDDESELDFPQYQDLIDSMTTNLGVDMMVVLSHQYLLFSGPRCHIDVVEQIQKN
jgi:hypothetical protein